MVLLKSSTHTTTKCKSLIYGQLRAIRNAITLNTRFDAVKGENRLSMEHRFFSQIRSFAPIYPAFELACSPKQGDPGPR
jgi:hypothetical protein